jgi:DNA-directed RNA polymerase specialized sigma24 family protein
MGAWGRAALIAAAALAALIGRRSRSRSPSSWSRPLSCAGPNPRRDRARRNPAEAASARAELADAVEALGPEGSPHRETWRLMYVEERTVAEVAELMAVPAGTVKSRASRVRRLMRAALRRHRPVPGAGER